ncbi:MAG TPA: DUF1987 domain-containing protein [Bacteroidia bacterium]|jgi:hypothetical protein|nr:DUF1987 domain-containing protein [Bacteroidia bacterium]
MKGIKVEGTETTPNIEFDPAKGKLEIKGISVPESARDFYKPLIECLGEYVTGPASLTSVDIMLDYFNTTSSKCLLDIFRIMQTIHMQGSQVVINWHYEKEDEDMIEAGENYQLIVSLVFNMIEAKGK